MIDFDDATDRLNCMANEININKHYPDKLKESLTKDKALLRALIPIVDSFRRMEGLHGHN